LSNTVTASVATFLHSGGTIGGAGNLVSSGDYKWTAGTASGSGTNTFNGSLTITGTVFASGRRLEPMTGATLSGGSVHLASGAVLTNKSGITFSILDDSSVFNDGGLTAPAFLNEGTVEKTGAGNGVSGVGGSVSRIDVPFINHGDAQAKVGTLQLSGGGVT